MNYELERMWKEAIVAYFRIVPSLASMVCGKPQKSQLEPMSRPRFSTVTYRKQVKRLPLETSCSVALLIVIITLCHYYQHCNTIILTIILSFTHREQECGLVGYYAVSSGSPTFRTNISPLSSGSRRKLAVNIYLFLAWLTFRLRRWTRFVPPKRRSVSILHFVTTHKTVLSRVTAVRT
jgi:hypothetical protein